MKNIQEKSSQAPKLENIENISEYFLSKLLSLIIIQEFLLRPTVVQIL